MSAPAGRRGRDRPLHDRPALRVVEQRQRFRTRIEASRKFLATPFHQDRIPVARTRRSLQNADCEAVTAIIACRAGRCCPTPSCLLERKPARSEVRRRPGDHGRSKCDQHRLQQRHSVHALPRRRSQARTPFSNMGRRRFFACNHPTLAGTLRGDFEFARVTPRRKSKP